MERRSFLRYLLGTAAAATIDYEQLLWIPKPIIVVPEMPFALTGSCGGINRAVFHFWRNNLQTEEEFIQASDWLRYQLTSSRT